MGQQAEATGDAVVGHRVLIVEDDPLVRGLLDSGLELSGFQTMSVTAVAEALTALEEFDPHVVLTDLHLGTGPSGADLLWRVYRQTPWVSRVVLSSHQSADLVASQGSSELPPDTGYIVKSALGDLPELSRLIQESLSDVPMIKTSPDNDDELPAVSSAQAQVLAWIAEGLNNAAIAERRGITKRAAEGIVQRTFAALGLDAQPDSNARVLASEIWRSGRVRVEDSKR